MENTSTLFLLKTEEEIVKALSKRPYSLDELVTKHKLSKKPKWYVSHCLERLEDEYLLVEELAQPEWEAFQQGRNYIDEPVGISESSGKYTLTHTGQIVSEQIADTASNRWRETWIPMVSAILGAIFGALSSLAVNFLIP